MNEDKIKGLCYFQQYRDTLYISSSQLQVNALQRVKTIHKHSLNLTFFHPIPIIFSLLIFSKNDVSVAEAIQGYLVPISLLLICYYCLLLCLKTRLRRWKVLSSKIKAESLLNGYTRLSPCLSQPSVVQFPPCNQISGLCFMEENNHWRLAAYNRFLWLLFQVGGKLVSWMAVRGILHCPLVLWNILYSLSSVHAD